jgi:hypothetical protein
MSNSTIAYPPGTFIKTTEVFEPMPAASQGNGDFALWEKEWEEFNPPVSSTGGSNPSTGSQGSSMSSGLIDALLPILAALIGWMVQAMSNGSQGGSNSEGGSEGGGGDGGQGHPHPMLANGGNPADIAEKLKGRSADSIVANQDVRMDRGISDHEDCANFASACLVKSGEIPQSQHTDSVSTLKSELLNKDGWHEVSKGHAKKGDICIVGGDQHVEIVEGVDKNGNPILVGSNNVLRDGSQAVCEDHGTGTQSNIEILSA